MLISISIIKLFGNLICVILRYSSFSLEFKIGK